MGSLFQTLLILLSISCSVVSQNIEGTVLIDGRVGIGRTDDDFICATLDWWPPEKCDYGTCSWGLASLFNLDLNNTLFLNAIKAFSPLKVRLGGSLQDKIIYGVGNPPQSCTPFVHNSSEMFGFTQGCLPMYRWDELNDFFGKAGAVVIFGLNALSGRRITGDSALGPWDSTNAASFIRYTANKGYLVHGWELGNELSGTGVGTKVAASQYSDDVMKLYSVVHDVYISSKVKPLIIAPGGFFDATWYKELVDKTPKVLDAVTHHIYNLGPGVDQHLVEKILDPSYLDGEASTFSSLQNILKTSASSATAWVGEAGGAYNSGHNLVTNAFVFSFWYLDQLGMSASYDTKTYCRQTLIGGNYGLLNTTTFVPNPDYYSALLWHRLMGQTVLKTNFTGTKKIRAYSHCAKQSPGITLLLINLDNSTTVQVHITTETVVSKRMLGLKHLHKHPRTKSARTHRSSKLVETTREEYHLTPKDGDLHSQTMLLNGNILAVNSSGAIPSLEPIHVNLSEPITIVPYSIVFVRIPSVNLPACR